MTQLSGPAYTSLGAEEQSEIFVALLTISHADLATPIRVCDDGQDLVSRGNTFTAFPFELVLPDEREDRIPASKISICAVDRRVVAAVEALSSAPTVTIEVVLRSSPDTLEYGPFKAKLRPVSYDRFAVEGDVTGPRLLDEPGEQLSYTPDVAPGLFP